MIKTNIKHTDVLFIDIETVSAEKNLFELPESLAVAWAKISDSKYKDECKDDYNASFKKYAALYPEYGRIVCVSFGWFQSESEFVVMALAGADEKALLTAVANEFSKQSAFRKFIGGHNIKNFDIPFIMRRAMLKGVPLPGMFDFYDKKPWEVTWFVDTMDVWKCGTTYAMGSSSLESIASAFGFPSPKAEMSGSMVSTYFYMPDQEKGLNDIGKYCCGDTIYCAGIYVRMTRGLDFPIKTVGMQVQIVK